MPRSNSSPGDSDGDGANPPTVARDDETVDLAMEVVETVAAATDSAATDLQPLYETVDPEALNAVFAPPSAPTSLEGTVSFQYAGCLVTVDADGTATASILDEE